MSAAWQAVFFGVSCLFLLIAAIIAWLESPRARYSLVVALAWLLFVFVFFLNALKAS